ncbi:MAG: acetolactate synthase small subunit [Spirochaetales bacterium]
MSTNNGTETSFTPTMSFEQKLSHTRAQERKQGRSSQSSETAIRKHSMSLLVNNRPGVLIRIALVFARRGYNIDSLVVSPTADKRFSVINMTATGEANTLHQILKQVNKLVDVVHATDHTDDDLIERELALIKISCEPEARNEILQIAHALDCKPVDLSDTTVAFEISGTTEALDNAQKVLERYGVMEMVRTGKLIMIRGEDITP